MPDFIDKARHWLIRKLSCGDMILLNFEVRSDRSIISRNLGPSLIDGAIFTSFKGSRCVDVGRCYKGEAAMGIVADRSLTISNSVFRSA